MATSAEQLEQELVTYPGRVIAVAGIGVSLATCGGHECASWKGLLRHGLQRCQDVCGTDTALLAAQRAILDNPKAPAHAWISVGQFITDELNAKRPGLFGAWLNDSIGAIKHTDTKLVCRLGRPRHKPRDHELRRNDRGWHQPHSDYLAGPSVSRKFLPRIFTGSASPPRILPATRVSHPGGSFLWRYL